MKRFRGLCLLVGLLVGCVTQSAALNFGSYEYTVDNDEVTITKFLCDTTEAVIFAENI